MGSGLVLVGVGDGCGDDADDGAYVLAGAALALFALFAAEDDLGMVVPGLLFLL